MRGEEKPINRADFWESDSPESKPETHRKLKLTPTNNNYFDKLQ